MGLHNKIAVKNGDILYNRQGIKTRWTVTGPSFIKHGKTYAPVVCVCTNKSTVRLAAVLSGKSDGCGYCSQTDFRDWPAVGEKIGGWTILSISCPHGSTKIRGQCSCGHIAWKSLGSLRYNVRIGNEASCAKCRPHRLLKKDFQGRYLASIWKHLGFTLDQIKLLANSDCFYCGGPPSNKFSSNRKALENVTVYYQGVDEVVYGQGHVIGNVLPCCIACNKAKSNQTLESFCSWYNRKRCAAFQLSPEAIIKQAQDFGTELKAASALSKASSSLICV